MAHASKTEGTLDARKLDAYTPAIFQRAGVPREEAERVADA
ncbi:MAG: hypothetical protein ACHQ7N_16475 [Candidatus Methylomirabilales bacterium]